MIFTGNTVDEAIENGLRELGIPRMKAHITVVSREKAGFFGFGKKPAQVDIDVISEKTVNKADKQASRGVPPQSQTVSPTTRPRPVTPLTPRPQPVVEPPVSDLAQATVAPLVETTSAPRPTEAPVAVTEEPELVAAEMTDLGIEIEPTYDIDEVVTAVTAYVQSILDDMDVEATIESNHNRRTINMQVETNEPGRVIGYHGKVLKSIQFLAQTFLYNRYARNFYITLNVNDYAEHRAEVLHGYAQKLAHRVLETDSAYQTDPMSSNERKIMHRIIAKIDGVTSYSEGSEPNRYVVVDLER